MTCIYISVQIGDPEIVNYFQVIESCSSCLDNSRGDSPIHLFSKKVRRIIIAICRSLFELS